MKLGVCVPYRNRKAHLKEFIPKVGRYLQEQGIDYQMYFGHQTDDKLFNRGAMKNIAAEWAFKEGCDYIVWHDIDMIPEKDDCDYSYPINNPRHIAVNISQSDYKLKYFDYFGGAVLFTKEQVERTNGYSNEYWDWGMEDDDLFWRCIREGYVDERFLDSSVKYSRYVHYNGKNAGTVITEHPLVPDQSHTVSILCRAYQQPGKIPIFLIGDKNKRFVEYPIIRIPGYDYGLSFNNSRAISFQFWDKENNHNYMWGKRFENQWTWVTVTVDADKKEVSLFLNGKQVSEELGEGSKSPVSFNNSLKKYETPHIYIGVTSSLPSYDPGKYGKVDVAEVKLYNRVLTQKEIEEDLRGVKQSSCFKVDLSQNSSYYYSNVLYKEEDIKVPTVRLPYRVPGTFTCLPHPSEGIIDDGQGNLDWKRGETTARNEQKFILEMQSGKGDYKKDGMNSLKYTLDSIQTLEPNAKMINVRL